jgi:hypothetical protein
LGFAVVDSVCRVGDVCFALGADDGRGLRGWSLPGIDGLRECAAVDPPDEAAHPNGVAALDHLVVMTPNHQRTLDAFVAEGWDLRRVRDADTYGTPMRQGFFKVDGVVLEIIGPASPAGDKPARLWGLAWTSDDLDATASYIGDRLHPAKDAVQEGRRIATLDKAAGSTVAMAFMSKGRAAV